ncbi:carbohydrate kinase family protein [Clostridium rectalis]|uniref:carbohydrate kinase family protein n=1 Tax=Clostridium rectalis TaxID=2040295 RepID=UPI000F637C8E|nr:carbohydrate kinase [Clostridium rectalis]
MFDVVAIGELLIDFTCNGVNEYGEQLFSRNAGGAPANVVAANSILGGKTAFIGKVGKDIFGEFLKNTLDNIGICTKGVVISEDENTTLAFVQLNEEGERLFSFYRKFSADVMLKINEINKDLVNSCNIFHFGSVSLTREPARLAVFNTVSFAKENGKIISYDPNYRDLLWSNESEAMEQIKKGIRIADIIKVSKEEMIFLTGEIDLVKGSKLLSKDGAALVLVTLGDEGAFYRRGDLYGSVPGCAVNTVDTTGAGDAFLGAIHYKLRNKNLECIKNMSKEQLENIIYFANTVGALTTTKKGAIPSLPSLNEVKDFIYKTKSS